MNTDEKFEQFIKAIDSELQARTDDLNISHFDFEEFDFRFEFEIGATVAETVAELLIQLKTTTRILPPL